MSIYSSLWSLRFPRFGDDHTGCEWVEVWAQGVPGHIGTPTPGQSYETGDPFGDFLPPPVVIRPDDDACQWRAVVFVRAATPKVGQRYVDPLLVISGEEYKRATFSELHTRICDALRGGQPRIVLETWSTDGSVRLMCDDGTSRLLTPEAVRKAQDPSA